MQKWYHIFPKNTGISLYVWLIFCILPFYFIFRSFSKFDLFIGVIMILLFFMTYRLSFISNNWLVYVWVSLAMAISIFMTLFFGYVYFSLFLSFFIGNISSKNGFITLYIVHLVSTIVTISIGFFTNFNLFFTQFPFIIICLIGVILLPFNIYNRNNREKLEVLLDDANEKISELLIMEERQRIARDLHDTLGQKLSLIGLKSDLAKKLIDVNPKSAKTEVNDIHQTARTALKEVREMVSNMRSIRLADEIMWTRKMLDAAQIEARIKGNPTLIRTTLLIENVLSLSLKEAVTNVVKHSNATTCYILIKQSPTELLIQVQDNGNGFSQSNNEHAGHGIQGMRERLEFINGSLDIYSSNGTTINIRIPNVIQQSNKEG